MCVKFDDKMDEYGRFFGLDLFMLRGALIGGIIGGAFVLTLQLYGYEELVTSPMWEAFFGEAHACMVMYMTMLLQFSDHSYALRMSILLRIVRHTAVRYLGISEIVYSLYMLLLPKGIEYAMLYFPWRRIMRQTRGAASAILVQPQSEELPPPVLDDDGSSTPPPTPSAPDVQSHPGDKSGYLELVHELKAHSLITGEQVEFDVLAEEDVPQAPHMADNDIAGAKIQVYARYLTKFSNLVLSICDYANRDKHSPLATLTFFRNIVRDLELSDSLGGSFMTCVKAIHHSFLKRDDGGDPVVDPQALSFNEFKSAFDNCRRIARNKLPGFVKQLLALTVGTVLAPNLLKSTGHMWRMIGKIVKKRETKESVLENMVESTWEMLDDGIDWLMNDETTPDIAKTLAASKAMREHAGRNELSMNTIQRDEWKNNYQFVHDRLVKLYAREVKNSSFIHSSSLDRERELLHSAFCKILKVRPEDKKEAICMIVVGSPGIGKSMLSQLIQDIVAVSTQGTHFDPMQVSVVGPTKFFDTLSTQTRCILVDDIMSGMLEGTQPNAACVNSKISELIIAAINPVVWTPPMASLEAKGNTYPDLALMIMTANWENGFGDMAQARCPGAAARRAMRFEVNLKPEYAGADGKLDLSKVDMSDLYASCPWHITVKKYNVARAAAANVGGLKSKLVEKAYEVAELMTENGPVLMSNVDTTTLEKFLIQEVRASHSRGDIATGIRDRTRARILARVQPQAFVDLGFYDVNNLRKWMPWAYSGRDDLTVPQEVNYLCNAAWTKMGMLKTLLRCFVTFPFGLTMARLFSRPDQGVFKTLRLFYTLVLADLAIGIVMGGTSIPGAQAIVPIARDHILSWSKCSDVLVKAARRARLNAHGAYRKTQKYHQPIVAGIFAGVSLYAIHTLVRFVKRNSLALDLLGVPQADDDHDPPSDGKVATKAASISIDATPNTNQALKMRARMDVYKGPHGGKNTDTVGGDKNSVTPVRKTASFDQVATCVAASHARIIVKGLSSPDLGAVVPGTTSRQFLTLLGQCHTGARALVNAHLFSRECKWFSVQIMWNPGRTTRPFILYASQIAFATDMAPVTLGDADGVLDLAMFCIPDFGAVRSIVDCFAEQATYKSTSLVSKRLGCKTYDSDYCHKDGLSVTPGRILGPITVRYDTTTAKDLRLLAVEIEGQGTKGQCGMAVLSGSCVIGIHSAGREETNTVFVTPVTQSVLKGLCTLHDSLISTLVADSGTAGAITVTPESLIFSDPWKDYYPGPLQKEFPVHEKSFVHRICGNSKFSIQGQLGIMRSTFVTMYRRNPLRKVVREHVPLVSDIIESHAPPSPDLDASKLRMIDLTEHATVSDPDALKVAESCVYDYFETSLLEALAKDDDFAGVGPTDLETALDGFDMALASRVDPTTSAGLLPGAKSKYMDSVHNPDLGRNSLMFKPDEVSQSIPECVEAGIARLKRGETLGLAASVVGKDEVLPKEQSVEGLQVPKMARLIHAGETSALLIFRMLFMPLLAIMGSNPISFGHFVGLNPTTHFSQMYKHLGAWDEVSYMAMDYSKFDMRTSVNLLNASVNIMIALTKHLKGYTDEHRRMMRTLCFDICNPIYNIDGVWVRFTGSNSSGNPVTTILNCIVNHLCWNQMWLMADHDKRFPDLKGQYCYIKSNAMSFYSFAKVVVLGDDCIVTVPLEFWFNQLTASEYAVKLGQVLTSAIKGAEITPFMRGVTFLKREIHVYRHASGKNLVLAPLALTSLLRPLAWGTWKTGLIEHFAGLIKGMLIELVQHGPVVYADYCVQFRNLISVCHVDHQQRTRNGSLRENLSSYFTDDDFRSWGERIKETYGMDADGLLDEPVTKV